MGDPSIFKTTGLWPQPTSTARTNCITVNAGGCGGENTDG